MIEAGEEDANMELRLNTWKRTLEPVRTERKAEAAPAASPRNLPRGDRLALSREAVAYVEERHRQNLERIQREAARMAGETEADGESGELEAFDQAMRTMRKCHEIAARIMRGDKVPPEDEAYLMQNDPTGYKLALAMRTPKKNPKEWESILDDEDCGGAGDAAGGEAVSAAGSAGGEAASSGEA